MRTHLHEVKTLATPQAVAVQNSLLSSLPPHSLSALLPKLDILKFAAPATLYRKDTVIDAVLFPVSGMVALLVNMENGDQAEVGVIGHEGMLGTSLLSGIRTSYVETMVQMPGILLRMTAKDFQHAIGVNRPLQARVLLHREFVQSQISQTVACNKSHPMVQRLARWLLMAHDRSDDDSLPLTINSLEMMLGMLQPGILVALSTLQQEQLIEYSACNITVLSRLGLEEASCGCYAALQLRSLVLLGKPEVSRTEHFWHLEP